MHSIQLAANDQYFIIYHLFLSGNPFIDALLKNTQLTWCPNADRRPDSQYHILGIFSYLRSVAES